MSPAVHTKHYADPARGAAARDHLRWLTSLHSGVRLPHLYAGDDTLLTFEHLAGPTAAPSDLSSGAAALGRLHATAHARELRHTRLEQPFRTATRLTIPAFHSGRQPVLDQLGIDTTSLPAAFYKDTNCRNIILTTDGPALVDFDDLTLAPFGYDLAKLIVSTAMTYGPLAANVVRAALDAYNRLLPPSARCPLARLFQYADAHHLLTVKYLHRNGYRYRWPDVCPAFA
jgi:hypothetical protein